MTGHKKSINRACLVHIANIIMNIVLFANGVKYCTNLTKLNYLFLFRQKHLLFRISFTYKYYSKNFTGGKKRSTAYKFTASDFNKVF